MAQRREKKAPPGKDRRPIKKKTSILTTENIDWIDYKDVNLLRRFMSERAKIRARRVTGNSQQQQVAVGGAGERRIEVDGERIGAFLREHGQIAQYGPEHDDIQVQGVVLAERGEVDAQIALLPGIPAPCQRLMPLDLAIPAYDGLIKGDGDIRHVGHGTHGILFFERKHGSHLTGTWLRIIQGRPKREL